MKISVFYIRELVLKRCYCIEREEAVHARQKFNKPFESVNCIYSSIEDYLEETELKEPVVLWLDFNDPKDVQNQLEIFSKNVTELPIQSIIRITLNANPTSLGKPNNDQIAVTLPGEATSIPGKKTELEWRLERFKERLADYYPANLIADDMTHNQYGKSLLQALYLAVAKTTLDTTDRKIVWALSTHYSDGQPMVTATLIIVYKEDKEVENIIKSWEFFSDPKSPHVLDLPALSTLERLTMESNEDPREKLGYNLPKSQLKEEPFETFKKFYRFFPHFSRVDI